ncbi:hypothetical protein ACVIGA_008290 [Bradyrhizobium sp. USDA 3240]
MLYYVEQPKLYVLVLNGTIFKIQRADRNEAINLHAIVVESFDATTAPIHVNAYNRLCLDGFALTDVMAWLYRRMPTASDKAFNAAFMRLFPNSSDITDIIRAVCRVVADIEHTAFGDCAWFCAKIRDGHAAEFEELRAAWKQQFN